MSDIPKAAKMIARAIMFKGTRGWDLVAQALPMLKRRPPDFYTPKVKPKPTLEQRAEMRRKRRVEGKSLEKISHEMGVNMARISETTNPKPKGSSEGPPPAPLLDLIKK